ncbi:hypothetical protein F4810DRAFT_658644 [Camillea tinctor]|nr:hypothetical protein F4810DRAFT_658644 [Camillea tinctor]
MPNLPVEIYTHILSFAPPDTLRSCRLVNKILHSIATPVVFRHIRLEATGDSSQFINIAKSETLRPHVREISIDIWVELQIRYFADVPSEPPASFFRALPFLRVFSNLKTLNLKFNERCGKERDAGNDTYVEDYDFRYWVMWTVFSSLTGDWEAVFSQSIYEEIDAVLYDDGDQINGEEFFSSLQEEIENWPQLAPIELETLTIGNLADYNDPRLTGSEIFKRVLRAPSLTGLKLYVVFEQSEQPTREYIQLLRKYRFMNSLSNTWLAPEVAKKLRVLSLFCEDYWGWSPKMDLRKINPGPGPDSGLPKLEVLALGNFVLSDEWQADWFASLGRLNDHGGLRELYLDNCPIVYASNPPESFDINIHDYYDEFLEAQRAISDGVNRLFPLRWHEVLNHWADNMNGLKVLKMGRGDWVSSSIQYLACSSQKPEIESFNWDKIKRRFSRTNFMTYDCSPPANSFVEMADFKDVIYGIGINDDPFLSLSYVQFNAAYFPSYWPYWLSEDAEMEMKRSEEIDNQALSRIKSLVGGR